MTDRAPFPIWLLEQSIRTSWPRRRDPKKRAQIRETARSLRVLKRSPEFITEASARALLAQQRWTLARKRADESAEFWQSPRGTDTVLFPLRPDFIDYRRCLVAVVRDVYEDVRQARKQRNQ